MPYVGCGSTAVTERPERIAQGYRKLRCRQCSKRKKLAAHEADQLVNAAEPVNDFETCFWSV